MNLLNRVVLITLCLYSFIAVNAQILTVDSQIEEEGEQRSFFGTVNAGFDYDEIEGKVFELESNMDLNYVLKKGLLVSVSQFDMTSSDGERAIDTGFSHLRYIQNYNAKITPEYFIQFQWDGVRGMKSRWIEGANLRFELLRDSLSKVFVGTGLFYETEVWDTRAVINNDASVLNNIKNISSKTVKLNFYFKVNKNITNTMDAIFISYFQFPISNAFQLPRIAPSLQLNMNVFKALNYSITLQGFYDFKPIVPIKKYTFGISNALVVEF